MDKCQESFCEDICNIARVLPNLTPNIIYEELNNLKDKPDRVQIILKKYFASYEEHNCLTDDIKKIKRVVPNYPFVQINNDLLAVEDNENRVQLVLKNHFDGQSKAAKRALLLDEIDLTDESPNKKNKFYSDAIENIVIPDEKEQSSNETENYSIEYLPVEDQLITEETNNVQEDKPETETDPQLLTKSPCVVSDDKKCNESENDSSQNSDQTNTETENILSVLSSIFPQHSLGILSTVCQDLDVDQYGPPNESTLELLISVLFDQVKKEETFERTKSNICHDQPVSSCSIESSENFTNSTTQREEKKDSNNCHTEECDQGCSVIKDNFTFYDLPHLGEREKFYTENKKNSEENNSTKNESASTNIIPSENIIDDGVSDINFDPNLIANKLFETKITENPSSVENIIDELSSTNLTVTCPAEPVASTSNFYNNQEYDTAINNLIQEFKDSVHSSVGDVLNYNANLEPTPSTSKLYDNSETSILNLDLYSGLNNVAESSISSSSESESFNNKLEKDLRNSNSILESNQNSVNYTSSNILDFETAFFNNINLNNSDMTNNIGGKVTSTDTKPPVLTAQINSIIKPATLKPNKSSTNTTKKIKYDCSNSDLLGTRRPTIIKEASFKHKTCSPIRNNVVQNAGIYKTANIETSIVLAQSTAANPLYKTNLNQANLLKRLAKNYKIITDEAIPITSSLNKTVKLTNPTTKTLNKIIYYRVIGVNPISSTSGLNKTITKTLNSRIYPKVIVDNPIPNTSTLNKTIVDNPIPTTSGLNKTTKPTRRETKPSNSSTELIGAKSGSIIDPKIIFVESNLPVLVKNNITNKISSTNPKFALYKTTNTNSSSVINKRNNELLKYNPANHATSQSAANPRISKSISIPDTSNFTALPSTSKSTFNSGASNFAANPNSTSSKYTVVKASTSASAGETSSKRKNFVQGLSKISNQSHTRAQNLFLVANDLNKNTIRVRTDLYDTYFNGPITSSKLKKAITKESNNDDIIFISADPIPVPMLTNINKEIKSKSDPIPIIIPKKEENPNISEIVNKILDTPSTSKAVDNHPFYFKLLEIFPDICPVYLRKMCADCTAQQTMDDLISILLNEDYRKRNRPVSPEAHLVFEEQHKILQDLFPDADPTYLQHHCERLIDQPDTFEQFVTSLVESRTYPTKAEYLKKMKLSAQEKQYTTEFDVKKFLEVIPNPEEFFNDPKRQISYANFDDTTYAVTFLKNMFCTSAIKDITHIFRKTNFSILRSANTLENYQNMKSKRKPYPVTSCKNIPLLQEIAYVQHRKEILQYLKQQKLEKQLIREEAKNSGRMTTCQCCYDDEIMPDEVASCEAGLHIFCKECVRRGCEVLIGDGKLDFPCLEACNSKFSLQVLQAVLSPKLFSKMAQRKQMEEVKSAGIEDLEFCPFCDFATIPAPGDKIFRCMNNDCMKESCRLCKEPSHIPLRCDEVEKDQDVKMRTYIENKMTEALLRKCYKCGMKFIKESGCNKMTCSCGAMMCYVCNQPVQDYKHFNGQGGDQTHLCPLYSDTHKLHMDAIKQSAETAKREMGVDKDHSLKIDPTADIDHHYRRLSAQNPAIPNIPVVFPNINIP